jgi:hypothetical protein
MKSPLIPSLLLLLAGCPSALQMRGARVLEEGKTETTYFLGLNGLAGGVSGTAEGQTESVSGALLGPWVAYSWRRGMGDRWDLQIKTDLQIFPEVVGAYQLLGNPADSSGVAVSVQAGARILPVLAAGGGDSSGGIFGSAGLGLLTDLPVSDAFAVTLSVKAVVMFADGESIVRPAVGLLLPIKLSSVTLLPEIGYIHYGDADETSDEVSASAFFGNLSLGVGMAF